MDGRSFDSLAQQLASGSSRRYMIKGLAGSGVALMLAGIGLNEAAAGKKKKKRKVQQRCKNSKQCRKGLACRKANSQQSCKDFKKRCCVPDGDPCDTGCDCCGIDVICNGGFCQGA